MDGSICASFVDALMHPVPRGTSLKRRDSSSVRRAAAQDTVESLDGKPTSFRLSGTGKAVGAYYPTITNACLHPVETWLTSTGAVVWFR